MKTEESGIMKKLKGGWAFVKQIFTEFIANSILKFSASLAYYTILSLVPLLVIILNITGFFFGEEAIRGELYSEINDLVGKTLPSKSKQRFKIFIWQKGVFLPL